MAERIYRLDKEYLNEGEYIFNQRLEVPRDVAREMQLTVSPDISDEDLERLTTPGYKRNEEFGWEWSEVVDVGERKVYGNLSLDVINFEDMNFQPTGDVTFSISTHAYLLNEDSPSTRGGHWSETLTRDDSMEGFNERALERLMNAWEELHDVMSRLPQFADEQIKKEEEVFRSHGLIKDSHGWIREQE